ncbi:retinol dehydrogenase 8-like [Bufo gargarizans]|uniref:retinol dehydrogenase 8-like n=1 Tax=Bufo gargarizans TaxID=30331 RepID=UPI001CF251CA|nr:retinol dehydrogenase 8-like [Bufo gargarizans]
MEPRTALITGCSSGIGLALAVKLAQDEQQRFKVIATMRNLEKREALEKAAGDTLNKTLEIKELDVRSERSIRDCVDSIPERRIDILINNAGVGLIGPIECQSMEDMQGVFETNFYGVVRMIKEVLPDMKKRRSGHILVMSSVMGLQGIVFNDIYAASKFAVEGFCESLVFQTLKFNIHLTLIEPGPVVTKFELKVYEDAVRGDYSNADPETSHMFTNYYLKNSKTIFSSLGQTPEEIAEHTLRVLTMEMPPFRHQTNHVYTPLTALKYADPSGELVNDVFYKIVFQHDTLMQASLRAIKLLRWKAQKVQQGARILGFL